LLSWRINDATRLCLKCLESTGERSEMGSHNLTESPSGVKETNLALAAVVEEFCAEVSFGDVYVHIH
jgi:hypothetical protein